MILHGLLHLIGSAREWNLGSQQHFSGKALLSLSASTSKATGVLWLLAAVSFIFAAILYLMKKEWYWIPAAVGILISQTLIIIDWQDAKYGTIVNAALLIVVIFSAAAMQFNTVVRREVATLVRQASVREQTITEEEISHLPENVQRWIKNSNILNRKLPTTYRVIQRGSLRTTADGRWMPFQSEQHFSINPPAFVWHARISAGPLFTIGGRDKYQDGRGHMLIKPLYLFTAANGMGKEIDQGTLLRYLAETAWFPQVAVNDYLRWESIDDRRARVTMNYKGISASGIFSFNDEGLVEGFEARRYGDFGGIYRKETWSVAITAHEKINNIPIGHRSEVTWKLSEGNFTWLKMEVTEIHPVQ